ncbi:MAG TPA: polysaccharide deacetylase family protein [Myxococcota bacterium]|nr:polysaccharide deacetylase family protein [Myxococcota bacterium]
MAGESPKPWFPAPAIQATGALHLCGAVALAFPGADWRAVAGALVANHAVLFAGCLVPRSRLLGPNIVRLPAANAERGEVALTFDDGPHPELTPRVLDLLDARGAKATFFAIGAHAAANAGVVRDAVARGHAVESHTQHHSHHFGWYGPRRLRREIAAAQAAIAAAAGRAPAFFRAPDGVRNPMLDGALARFGLRYVSWRRRGFDAVDANADRVLARLLRGLAPGDVLMLHDGSALRRPLAEPAVLKVLPRLLDALAERGLRSVSLRQAFGVAAGA